MMVRFALSLEYVYYLAFFLLVVWICECVLEFCVVGILMCDVSVL